LVTKQRKAKDARLRREFHITLQKHDKVLKFQNNACAICGNRLNKKGKPLVLGVDHNHATGEVRGLLCWPCNKAIAVFQDDAQRMLNASNYIKLPPFESVFGFKHFTAPGKIGSKARAKLLEKMRKDGKEK
jgi:hypothetical protein